MNSMETRLRAAWCQVLDMEEDDLDSKSHFFREGGDSVAAVRLVSAAEDCKIRLDYSTIYNFPILKDMAFNSQEIQDVSDAGEPDPITHDFDEQLVRECVRVCKVEQQAIEDIFPATELQKIFLKMHMEDGSTVLQYVFQIHGPARKDLIREVVEVIRQSNQILRTRMVQYYETTYQVVVKDLADWYEGTDLSEYQRRVFSLDGRIGYGDSLFRYAFIEENRDLFLVCTMQHSGYDRWTNHLIFDALEEGLRNLEALRQKPVQTQFMQFCRWLEQHRTAEDRIAQSMAFWKAYYDGFKHIADSSSVVPAGMPNGTIGYTKIMPLKRRPYAFPLSTMAHAAWTISLGNIYQDDDILFMISASGRQFPRDEPLPKAELVMGLLAIAIYFRARLRADQTMEDFLRDTHENILSTTTYQREAIEAGAEFLGPQAIFLATFNWHPMGDDIPARIIDFEGQDGLLMRLEGRRDLCIPLNTRSRLRAHVWEHHDHLRIEVNGNKQFYNDDQIALILDQLTKNLARIVASRDVYVGDLWKMQNRSENLSAHKRAPDERDTSVTTEGALVKSAPPGHGRDVLAAEGQDVLTNAVSEAAIAVQH